MTRLHSKESEIQRAILELLAAERIFAIRYNTAAFKVDGRFFRAHSAGAGHPDIIAWIPGHWCEHCETAMAQTLFIEVKAANGRQTPDQKSFEETVTELGMHYLVARSVDEVRQWLEEHR